MPRSKRITCHYCGQLAFHTRDTLIPSMGIVPICKSCLADMKEAYTEKELEVFNIKPIERKSHEENKRPFQFTI